MYNGNCVYSAVSCLTMEVIGFPEELCMRMGGLTKNGGKSVLRISEDAILLSVQRKWQI